LTDPNTNTPAALVDISGVSVDKTLPVEEKTADFVRQIKDPYRYTKDGVTITAQFAADAPTLADCYKRLRA
jgi:hypothetical protein